MLRNSHGNAVSSIVAPDRLRGPMTPTDTAALILLRHGATVAARLRAPRLNRGDLIRATGISPARLAGWINRGQLHLDADASRDAGTHRRFSALDAVRVAVAAELAALGLRAAVAVVAAEAVGSLAAAHAASLGAGAVLPSGPLVLDTRGPVRCFPSDSAPDAVALVHVDPWPVLARAAEMIGEPLLADEGAAA
jgi:hypothetical protein